MNQANKQLIHAGPYKLDMTTHNVVGIRGDGQALIGKFAPGTYIRKDTIQVNYKQAEAHAELMLEALHVFALIGQSPMEMHITLKKIYA